MKKKITFQAGDKLEVRYQSIRVPIIALKSGLKYKNEVFPNVSSLARYLSENETKFLGVNNLSCAHIWVTDSCKRGPPRSLRHLKDQYIRQKIKIG